MQNAIATGLCSHAHSQQTVYSYDETEIETGSMKPKYETEIENFIANNGVTKVAPGKAKRTQPIKPYDKVRYQNRGLKLKRMHGSARIIRKP